MSGWGDNNKHGSPGPGAGNQSNQPFVGDGEKQPRSDHDMASVTAEPSIKQDRVMDASAHRNVGSSNTNPRSLKTTQSKTFNLLVDNVPYIITATPFSFNEEIRYDVSVNGGDEHVFTWDSQLKMLRAIDEDAAILPDSLEEAISERLKSKE